MSDNELRHYQVKDEPQQWGLVGEFEGISVRGLSETPDTIVAELYTTHRKGHAILGSVTLRHSGEPDNNWHGIEQLVEMIQRHQRTL